jgi:hypothetical protein
VEKQLRVFMDMRRMPPHSVTGYGQVRLIWVVGGQQGREDGDNQRPIEEYLYEPPELTDSRRRYSAAGRIYL